MSASDFERGKRAGRIRATPRAKSVGVSNSAGIVHTIQRMLGSASTLSLATGTNVNLFAQGADIFAYTAISYGESQTAVVREVLGAVAVEYPITLTVSAGPPSIPRNISLSSGNNSCTVNANPPASNGGSAVTGYDIYRGTTVGAETLLATNVSLPYADNTVSTGNVYFYRVAARNVYGPGPQSVSRGVLILQALSTAKYDGDSRTASMGGFAVASSTATAQGGFGTAYNMAGFIQAMCNNRWLIDQGYNHGVGASTTLAQKYRDQTTSITTSGNPAGDVTGQARDYYYSYNSDGKATVLTQTGQHIITCSASVNDVGYPYYNTPQTAWNTLRTMADIADAYGTAGKCWYVGTEFPRGDSCFPMESKAVSGGTCTATNTTNFVDGESFGAVGVVGVFASGSPRPLVKVASAPGQDQYTVTSGGVYTFGGTAPTTVYLTYNASPSGGRIATYDHLRIVNEWVQSSAANFVSTVNGVYYGIPGLRYNRPWVRVADTWSQVLDTSSGTAYLPQKGLYDNLQLHGNQLCAYKVAAAFKATVDADYANSPTLDQRPTRNNWYAARGTGSGTAFSGTLPPTMRTGFTGTAAPTLISINGAPIGQANTSTGAITGTGITSGSLDFATGVWAITFTAATSMPANAQLWFEQDIGNYNLTTMAEGTIGRNMVMNGLMDPTAAVGTNLTTTTGTSSISTVAASGIPYGWSLSNTAMQTAITAGTATVTVANETDADGFPRFVVEASGSAAAATGLQVNSGNVNTVAARMAAGDWLTAGGRVRYAKHSTIGRYYGTTGVTLAGVQSTSAITIQAQSVTSLLTRIIDGGTGMFIDDSLLDAAGGAFDFYRITPRLDTTGSSLGGTQCYAQTSTQATTPFAYRMGLGRMQARRRNDV
ncbi:fibronectin type III domain-containing protein [Novosphingobium sediminicola]|uniref:Fibronectin type-III domain-containing protein n=1 Tax=Novosphingobium sediminicola TaxID=563162 RepID=A0A7W6CHH3_9SPHN|nr:fibronectin type III domain-containing protein [Novosphingobium sediminicola]MBB3955922.1 hypothetical protein [Novosphingobium sediminicola]